MITSLLLKLGEPVDERKIRLGRKRDLKKHSRIKKQTYRQKSDISTIAFIFISIDIYKKLLVKILPRNNNHHITIINRLEDSS